VSKRSIHNEISCVLDRRASSVVVKRAYDSISARARARVRDCCTSLLSINVLSETLHISNIDLQLSRFHYCREHARAFWLSARAQTYTYVLHI
jgi:hypothetical protein